MSYLVEYLPFETETESMMESVRMVLQPGLLDQSSRLALWKKAARKGAYLAGFLAATPNDLPELLPPLPDLRFCSEASGTLTTSGNRVAYLLSRSMAGSGQAFFDACLRILKKPAIQDQNS